MVFTLPSLGSLVNRLHPHHKGRLAEMLAGMYLFTKGFRPFRRPGRAPVQTDLLLTNSTIVLLVEVKFRQSRPAAALALTPAQTKRLRAEAHRLAAYYPTHTLRADVVEVFPQWPFLHHTAAAIPLD